jgi:hypothetical protein
LTRVVRNVPNLRNKLKDTNVRATLTGAHDVGPAVENKLDTEIDVVPAPSSSDLDAISEATQRAVTPTRPTVHRKVLIERMGQVGNSVNIAPREVVR